MPDKRKQFVAESTGEGTQRIVLRPPTPDSPGYLRRSLSLMEAQERMRAGEWRALYDLIDLIAMFIVEPEDLEARKALLLDASESQWNELVSAVTGVPSKNSSAAGSETPSATGIEE
jgi:hypothetical protein